MRSRVGGSEGDGVESRARGAILDDPSRSALSFRFTLSHSYKASIGDSMKVVQAERMLGTRALSFFLIALLTACSKPAEPPATSQSAATPTPNTASNIHQFRIGELAAVALKDNDFVFANDAKTFAVGHAPEEVATVLAAASVPTHELSLSVQPLLVKAHDRTLLFDTGAGGKLLAALSEAGVDAGSVTDIFISHAHGDHVGGLVNAERSLVFPNATVHMAAAEWNAAQSQAENASWVQAVTPRIDAFAPGSDLIPGIVKAVDIKGHTPGHSGYLVSSGADSLLYLGDTVHHYIVSVQQPEWTIQFDGDAPTAQESRKALLTRSAETHQRIYAVHFPFPGLGKFTQQGDKVVWAAEF